MMAAELNARHNKQQTIAFTLPISCQVCLGKVKNPALCPNNHVFCSTCLDVWLQKNKQCPACRVNMTTPKKIMGGVNHQDHETDKLTNPELRKARFDLLYKEYENEFERMQSEIHLLKTENQILKQQTRKDGLAESRSSHGESSKSAEQLLVLTKKLQDATKLYEKMKAELTRVKQENTNLKDENVSLNRENQNLRQELAGRSPHRYGRITVQTLESKLASAEKDVTRLTKALERSDKYIEELEKERDEYKGISSSSKEDRYSMNGDILFSEPSDSNEFGVRGDNSRRQLFSDEKGGKSGSGERSKYYYDRNGDDRESDLRDEYLDYEPDKRLGKATSAKSNGSNGGKKRVTFDLNKNTDSTAVSFELEMPSPVKVPSGRNAAGNRSASPVKGVLKKGSDKQNSVMTSHDGYSSDLSKTLEDDSLLGTYSRKPSDRFSKDDDLLYRKSRTLPADREYSRENTSISSLRKKYSADDSVLSQPSDLDRKSYDDLDYMKKSGKDYDLRSDHLEYRTGQSSRSKGRHDDVDRSDLDDTNYIESELDELNISLTPEFTDCMKLLNRAEKKVQGTPESDLDDLPSTYKSTRDGDLDAAFRASTGSIGFRGGNNEHFVSYKPETDRFTSSLDTYSRSRHVRSGSLDNILLPSERSNNDLHSDLNYRPSSALPTASNMYPPTSQSKYSTGLTTGRTTLTRTPSVDNLLLTRPSTGYQNKYTSITNGAGFPSRIGQVSSYKPYSENSDQLDVNGTGVSTVGSSGTQPFPANHGILTSGTGLVREGEDNRTSFDAVLQARARSLSGYTGSTNGGGIEGDDKKALSTGRLTPTLPTSGSDLDFKLNSDRDFTSEYTTKSGMGSGRSTPTLTSNSDFNSQLKSNSQFSDYKYMGTDMSLKPPTGCRSTDVGPSQSASGRSSSNYSNPSSSYTNNYSVPSSDTQGYSSMPNFSSHNGVGNGLINGGGSSGSSSNLIGSGSGGGMFYDGTKYEGKPFSLSADSKVSGDKFEMNNNKVDFSTSSTNYRSSNFDDKNYISTNSAGSSVSTYKDYNYRDGTDFSNFSTKVASSNLPFPGPKSTVNVSSGSFAGSSYGLGASSSSFSSSSYMPTTLTGVNSVPSYSTAHSVPFTYTSSSYTSSGPVTSYTSKSLDPIAESSNHYSYVSNASGDFSSKNDTFALPEPKKRLFDNSEDLDMSVSPIKANRRF